MSLTHLEDFTKAYNLIKKPEEVDALFAKMETTLTESARQETIDDIERLFVGQVRQHTPGPSERRIIQNRIKVLEHLTEAAKSDTDKSDFYTNMRTHVAGSTKAEALLSAQVFINIHKAKGDKANPVVLIFIEEMNKIPADQRNYTLSWMHFKLGLYDRVSALPEPKGPVSRTPEC